MSFRLQLLLARACPRQNVVSEKSLLPTLWVYIVCVSNQTHSHLRQLAVIARFTFHWAGELQWGCYFPALWISFCSEFWKSSLISPHSWSTPFMRKLVIHWEQLDTTYVLLQFTPLHDFNICNYMKMFFFFICNLRMNVGKAKAWIKLRKEVCTILVYTTRVPGSRSVLGSYIFSKMIKTHKRFKYQDCLWIIIKILHDLVCRKAPLSTKRDETQQWEDQEWLQSAVSQFHSLHSITILTFFVAKDKIAVRSMRKETHQLEYNTINGEKHKIWRKKAQV